MSSYNIIKLKNISPLHISKGKEFYDSAFDDVLSDELSAALAAIRANLCGKGSDVEAFLQSFKLSSAFPFYKDELYLPKPQGRINLGIEERYRKKLKKIKYIEKSIFESYYLKGDAVSIEKEQLYGDLVSKTVISEEDAPYKKHEVERVAIPKEEGKDSVPYFFELKYFSSDAGLYCITDAKDEKYDELLDLFAKLGREGIGSDRNVGCGHFDVERGTIDIIDIESPMKLMLSMYIPTEEELQNIDLENSVYQLLLRGGYMAGHSDEQSRHYLKKAVYMFGSSSMLYSDIPLEGRIVDLSNNLPLKNSHKIYRSGRALCIPIINQK